ncbi:MAG: SAM-dependent methyltransferase, partial [Candidatus Nanopelagicales bacterium]
SDRFCFEGFLPRKTGERDRRLWSLVAEQRTMVFFEAPHRITETLAAMERAFGANRRAAVCRELTKTYEQVTRSGLADLVEWSREGVRGEISIVVEGADSNPAEVSDADLVEAVADLMAAGLDKRTATAQVAVTTGQQKRRVYNAVLAAKPTP